MIKTRCDQYRILHDLLIITYDKYKTNFATVIRNDTSISLKHIIYTSIIDNAGFGICRNNLAISCGIVDQLITYNLNEIFNSKWQLLLLQGKYLYIIPHMSMMLNYIKKDEYIIEYMLLQDIILYDIAKYIIMLKLEYVRMGINNYITI